MKPCARCKIPKPLDCFGVARSEDSGRNRYCKPCARDIVYASRERMRATPKIRSRPLSALEKTVQAIVRGHRTRSSIRRFTGLSEDRVADALAILADRNRLRFVKIPDDMEFHLAA